ncbi:proton pump-interactor 1-like isoform X1 [Lycium barbarum]|uniref:proton pump-interactor 1-like isoform X1 n=1 Tax=Lycium barbarum TaxID=112863 RepID=UPI00293F2CF3|nr:proton pump-interactor 1-like isoform X1 [Lycium barbarum]
MESQLAHVSVETVSEKNKLPKENQKMKNHGVEVNEPIKFGSHGIKESIKEEGKKAPAIGLRKDAVEDWPEPKQIHSFYIIRYRRYEDPKLKPKFDQAEKELQKMNKERSQIIEKLRAKRAERSGLIGQRQSVSAENQEFWTVIDGKRKEMEPLQDALGKLRGPRKAGREGSSSLCSSEEELDKFIKSLQYRIQHEKIPLNEEKQILREIKRLEGTRAEVRERMGKLRVPRKAGREGSSCSSEEELDNLIKSLQYCIQHESIPLTEEKKILREIKRLEGTRGEVRENMAMRAQIQDSMGEKETIQKQVKLISGNLDGVRKEQQAVKAKLKVLDDQLDANTSQIKSLDEELKELTKKRDKAFVNVQELRNQREEGNAPFYQNFALLQKAKLLADKKDVEALKQLTLTEVDKFISLFSGSKPFRDDYERRILTSLDIRQLSRDGRMRNPDEKPLVLPQAQTVSQSEIVEKTNARPKKEESVPPAQNVNKDKNTKKPKDASSKVTESTTEKYIFHVEEEIHGLENKPKSKEYDEARLKEMKKEEEIAKNRQAMERKKKLAEKAAAKAARKAQKEAERKKLKEIILIILSLVFGFASKEVTLAMDLYSIFTPYRNLRRRRRRRLELLFLVRSLLRNQVKQLQRLLRKTRRRKRLKHQLHLSSRTRKGRLSGIDRRVQKARRFLKLY